MKYFCKDEIIAMANITTQTFYKYVKRIGLPTKCGYSILELKMLNDSIKENHIKMHQLKKILISIIHKSEA